MCTINNIILFNFYEARRYMYLIMRRLLKETIYALILYTDDACVTLMIVYA